MNSVHSPKICVAGCGRWGRNLVRVFHQLGHLNGVFDANLSTATEVCGKFPEVKTYQTFEEALADAEIQAVVIAAPAECHGRLALRALQSGKDCFVEKPLALYSSDAQQLVDEAKRRSKILMVGHLLRYHPATRAIEDLLESGELGRLEYVYSNRLSMGRIRQEENALWSFAPHDISLILMLMRQVPIQVTAVGGSYLQPNVADVTVSNLLFEHGARAHVFVSWLHPHKEQRLVVIGSKKMVVFEDSRQTDKLLLYDKEIAWKNGSFEVAQPRGIPVPFDTSEPLGVECRHFIECVRTRRTPVTDGEEGMQVLQVLEACQRSLELNGDPVTIQGRHSLHAAAV